jgi:ATP adenylyltransferase
MTNWNRKNPRLSWLLRHSSFAIDSPFWFRNSDLASRWSTEGRRHIHRPLSKRAGAEPWHPIEPIVIFGIPCYSPAMARNRPSAEQCTNLWAPWRLEYIQGLSGPEGRCFLCRDGDRRADDRKNLVLWRGRWTMTVLNRFPYTGGHCLVAPLRHVDDLAGLREPEQRELWGVLRDLPRILAKALGAKGFNIGINLGRCAGAGLPGHLHAHIVPRWEGDTNFMAVLGDVRVIPQSLLDLYDLLLATGRRMRLPRFSGRSPKCSAGPT